MKFLAILLGVIFLLTPGTTTKAEEEVKINLSNKEKVVALLTSIETGDPKPISYINPDKYIQHNLIVSDGLTGFGEVIKQLPEAEILSRF